MTDAKKDEAFALAASMSVRTVNLMFSMKRTVKDGDDYKSFEASEAWTFKHDLSDTVTPEAARAVALVHGPALIKNVVMALHVGGVLPLAEAKIVVERVKRTYGLLRGDDEPTGNHGDLSDAGHAGSAAGPDGGVGAGVPEGQAAGVPGEAEHGHGPDHQGQ